MKTGNNAERAKMNFRQGRSTQRTECSQCNGNARQHIAMETKREGHATQSIANGSERSKFKTMRWSTVAEQSNVSKCNGTKQNSCTCDAKQCSARNCNALQRARSPPRNPRNSEIPGTGNPRKDPEEPRLGVASAIGSLAQIRRPNGPEEC